MESRSSPPLLSEEKHTHCLILSRSLAHPGLPTKQSLSLNGQLPWPHERCSGTMSKPSHYIEPCHQFQGWVTGASPLRDLSSQREDGASHSCLLTTPGGILGTEKEKSCEQYTDAAVRSQISYVPFYSFVIRWSLIHVALRLQDRQFRMIKEKQKKSVQVHFVTFT